MQLYDVNFPPGPIADFCHRHGVRTLAVFGSITREDFTPTSDIDALVEFAPQRGPSLLVFAGMQAELTELLGRAVHLHTPAMLPPRWREDVRREARVQYAA